MLQVNNLEKSYGKEKVIKGISFSLAKGECFALLGPNGAGKTTALRCCLGLIGFDSGKITLVGEAIPQFAREARAKVGIVPQFDNLDPDFTTTENLLVYGRYFALSEKIVAAKVPALLEFAGLSNKADVPIQSLSGGMRRRLSIARALINDPQLLILDEPTTGLDPQARRLIWERLRGLVNNGTTILLTTHFMEEAERLSDRIAIMDNGKIVASGPHNQLIDNYQVNNSEQTRPQNLEDLFLALTGHELRD